MNALGTLILIGLNNMLPDSYISPSDIEYQIKASARAPSEIPAEGAVEASLVLMDQAGLLVPSERWIGSVRLSPQGRFVAGIAMIRLQSHGGM